MPERARSTSNPTWSRLARGDRARPRQLPPGMIVAGRGASAEAFTVAGAAAKTMILLGVVVLSGAYSWYMTASRGFAAVAPVALAGMLLALIVALVTIFRPASAPWSAPLYAVLEGGVIGYISALYSARTFTFSGLRGYPGIVPQAVVLTLVVVGVMLALYRAGIIQPTERFRSIVVSATGAIAMYYVVAIVGSFAGFNLPFIHDNGVAGIAFSVLIIGVAASNLILDFAQFDQAADLGVKAEYEWFAAFGILLTILWLYLEILRLLAKLRKR